MRRSPLQRRTPLRASVPAKAEVPLLKLRKCANCPEKFRPFSSLVKWCSHECGAVLAMSKLERQKLNKAKAERAISKAKREELKTIPDLLKEAQREFNRYVRLRDAGKPCICCGLPLEAGAVGGGYDCGHYRSVGSAPHLRFDERNAHGQRKHCNRYGAGRAVDYRLGLLVRLGADVVEALESNNTPIKWTREGLREIRDTYRRKARELESCDV